MVKEPILRFRQDIRRENAISAGGAEGVLGNNETQ